MQIERHVRRRGDLGADLRAVLGEPADGAAWPDVMIGEDDVERTFDVTPRLSGFESGAALAG